MDMTTVGYLLGVVKKTITGLGIVKGSACMVKSIVPLYSTVDPTKPTRYKVTLQWDSQTVPSGGPIWHEESYFILDYARGIYKVEYDPAGSSAAFSHYKITFYDGTFEYFDIPTSSGSMKKKVVSELPPIGTADKNCIYLVPVSTKPGCYQQWIAVENETGTWEWLSLGTTDVDLTEYQKKIDANINKNYPNYDPGTKALQPIVPNVVGAVNEFNLDIGATYDYANNKIDNLTTHNKTNLVSAINEMGNLLDLEEWNPGTSTPATLVNAINIANKVISKPHDSSIDRTKYLDTQRLMRDNRDGSPLEQIGDPILTPRVDLKERGTPATGSYRSYDLYVAGNTFDALDPAEIKFGKVEIPKINLVKEDPVLNCSDTITPAAWNNPSTGTYVADIYLSHVPYKPTLNIPTVIISPDVGGTATVAVSEDTKNATVTITGATSAPIVGTTQTIVTYKGRSESLSAVYWLQIEGKDWTQPICGPKIELNKDFTIKDASVKVCTELGIPLPHLHVGDKYLDIKLSVDKQ